MTLTVDMVGLDPVPNNSFLLRFQLNLYLLEQLGSLFQVDAAK